MYTEMGSYIGRRAEALRVEQRLSKAELANRTGIDASGLGVILNGGRKEPSIQTVVKLSRALGVPISELIPSLNEPAEALAPELTVPQSEWVEMQNDFADLSEKVAKLNQRLARAISPQPPEAQPRQTRSR